MTRAGPSEAGVAYRGFLFADLRGYTADVERYGDRAASAHLDAYRTLVRAEIAKHAGAEIRTEGDSFYVVFPSAQRAVRCALGLQAAAVAYNDAQPQVAIRVGIGIHAGEVVEGSEGYVGAAVNVAARICALAGPGEVLVSRTVRDLTRAGLMLATQPRGSHRLKGIREPIEVFAIRDEAATPVTTRRVPRLAGSRSPVIGVALVVAVAAIVIAIIGGRLPGFGVTAAPSASPAASAPPDARASAPIASVGASATGDRGQFPNAAEAALRARLDPDLADYCRRADPADAPRVTQLRGTTEVFPLPVVAGLRCELVLPDQPDVVHFWHAAEHIRTVDDAFFRFTGAAGLRPGDCAIDDLAYGDWEFGHWSGNVACTVSADDARIFWTYDGERIMGIAVRDDADSRALYGWWRENGRLLGTPD